MTTLLQRAFAAAAKLPPAQQDLVASRVLAEVASATPPPDARPRGFSAAEVQAIMKIGKSAPDDATIKQWIDEHRMDRDAQQR